MDRPIVQGALKLAWLREDDPQALLVQRVARLRAKIELDQQFLRYLLLSPAFHLHVESITTGANVPHISGPDILRFRFPAPPLEVQVRIGSLLSAYDDLIAANARRMALLEESVHLLYREWFERMRFPGHEWKSLENGIPSGWGLASAGDAIAFNERTPVRVDDQAPFVPMSSLATTEMNIEPIEQRVPGGGARFRNGDTLLARITPCLENGKTGFVQFLPDDDTTATGSTEFIVMRGKQVPPTWAYCLARSEAFRRFAINHLTGSDGRQRVSADELAQYQLLVPSPGDLEEWERFAQPRFEAIHVLARQNAKLREARDYLLPRLMSGQLAV